MLYRAIEKKKEKLDEIALQKLFSDESDLIIASSDERVLSLNKFIELSMKNNLFKKEKIDQFIANVDLGVIFFFKINIDFIIIRILSKILKIWSNFGKKNTK